MVAGRLRGPMPKELESVYLNAGRMQRLATTDVVQGTKRAVQVGTKKERRQSVFKRRRADKEPVRDTTP